MKKLWILACCVMLSVLASCGKEKEDTPEASAEKKIPAAAEESQSSESAGEAENGTENDTEDEDTDEEESADAAAEPSEAGENILKHKWSGEFEGGDVVMTIPTVEFVKSFTVENGDDDRGSIADSETLFHLTGTISNDTKDSFSFANPLAPVKFTLLYDNKHEFELTGDAESPDGTEFIGASIQPLGEQTFHVYANVPLPVAESGKPLAVIISGPDGEQTIDLR